MAFERLGDVIDRVLSRSGIDVGNGAAATAPGAGKKTPTKAGASLTGGQTIETEAANAEPIMNLPTIGRGMATASPNGPAPGPAVVIPLAMYRGGSRGREEDTAPAAVRATGGGNPRGTVLRFVHSAASRARTCEAPSKAAR